MHFLAEILLRSINFYLGSLGLPMVYDNLHWAVKDRNKDRVEALIEKGADVNVKFPNGDDLLNHCIIVGNTEIAKALIRAGANVNKKDHFGWTPLHNAISFGNTEIVKALIEARANVNEKTTTGCGYLNYAIIGVKNAEIVKALIEAGANVNEKTDFGSTPLYDAISRYNDYGIRCRSTEIVKALIEAGASIHEKCHSSFTHLSYAIFTGQSIAWLLIADEIRVRGFNSKKPEYLQNSIDYERAMMSEYWDECLGELKRIKEKEIYGTILYDTLISKNGKLTSYRYNKSVAEVLGKSDYRNEFPIYADDLERKFKIVNQRLDALCTGEIIINHFNDFKRKVGLDGFRREVGPFNLQVAEYLSNEDIKNLRKAAIQTMSEGCSEPRKSGEEIPKSLDSVNVKSVSKLVSI